MVICDMLIDIDSSCFDGSVLLVCYVFVWIVFVRLWVSCR